MIAQQIDNYQIEDDAARTTVGLVYRAIDVERERAVRLTIVDPAFRQIPQFERRFAQAARRASGLRGDGVARVVGFGRAGDTLYLAHEAVEGRSPVARAARRLPAALSLRLAARAAEAVAQIHGAGVVHARLTPASLLVSRARETEAENGARWRVAVADFGLPLLAMDEMALLPGLAETVLPFAAPERAAEDAATVRADLYSLGAILYYLLTGEPLASIETAAGDLEHRYVQQAVPLQERRPELPSHVVDLVNQCLAQEPAARFESAEQMARALDDAVAGAESAESPAAQGPGATAPGAAPASEKGIVVSATATDVELQPGEAAKLQVAVRNQGNEVKHVTVKVEALPKQWVGISQEFVRVAPGTEMALTVTIRPPKDSSASAGEHPFRILVVATGRQPKTEMIHGRLTVQPFSQTRVDVAPLSLENGGSANVTIKNEGNAPQALTVRGDDPHDALRFAGERQELTVAPGSTTTVPLRVSARKQPTFGSAQTAPFSIIVAGDPAVREERHGELYIPPAIPRWLAMVMAGLLLVATLAGVIALTPFSEEVPGAAVLSPTATVTATDEATSTVASAVMGAEDMATVEAPVRATEDADREAADSATVTSDAPMETGVGAPGEPEVTGHSELPVATSTPPPAVASQATVDALAATETEGSGNLIAYEVVDRQGDSAVRLVTSDGLEDRRLATDAARPAWSPDGRRLAVLRPDSAGTTVGGAGDVLHVFTAGGSDLGPLTEGGQRISGLAWSPDGTQIAFDAAAIQESAGTGRQIYAVASDGASLQQVTDTEDGTSAALPVWSPDGSRLLVYHSSPQEAAGALYAVDFAGGSQQQLVSGQELGMTIMDTGHDWSPDGSRIVFSARSETDSVHLYVANADGSEVTQLTSSEPDAYHVAPDWSPGGDRILYLAGSESQAGGALQWLAPDGTATRQSGSEYIVHSAAWSSDGDQIVFSASAGAESVWQLYRVFPGGGAPLTLTMGAQHKVSPAWQP